MIYILISTKCFNLPFYLLIIILEYTYPLVISPISQFSVHVRNKSRNVVEISCYTEDIYIKIRRNIFIIYLYNKYLKRLIFISLFNELYVSFIRFCVFTWRTHACEYICINKSLKKNLFTYPPDGSSKINNSIIIEL